VITRQALINDDLGAFDRMPMLLGRSAAETEAARCFGRSSPRTPRWATAWRCSTRRTATSARRRDHDRVAQRGPQAAMRKQKGLAKKAADAEPLNLTPAFIVVSPDKETEAQQFLATTLYPNAAGR
jgi:hypothetical protein